MDKQKAIEELKFRIQTKLKEIENKIEVFSKELDAAINFRNELITQLNSLC